ncbi:MAG: 30S ribosomal protein S5 [candidate division WOR-3 bacterium]|nr:30S ribosomal protein S5 [candidate division WOR-3 bacterium]
MINTPETDRNSKIIVDTDEPEITPEFIERVIFIKRIAKVVKGGKRMRIAAGVVAGDGKGKVGIGHGKSAEVALAVRKAATRAKKNMISIAVVGNTISHQVEGKYRASKVLLKPAPEGTGLIACPQVRAVVEALGIKDIYTKSLGSNTPYNLAMATLRALMKLRTPEDIARVRNKPLEAIAQKTKKKDTPTADISSEIAGTMSDSLSTDN